MSAVLRLEREKKEMSAMELSKMMGVSISAVYKWESGERMPAPVNMRRLSLFFGKSVDELFFA